MVTINRLESLEPVRKQATHVHVNRDKVRDFAGSFDRTRLAHWLCVSPFDLDQLDEKEKLGFLFTLNAMSFSYWGTPKWRVVYQGMEYDGAKAMIACLGRARENGVCFNPDYLANIQREDLENILRGNVEIPLLDERLYILKEVGAVTQRSFRGDFRYIVDRSQGDALHLVDLLVGHFPSFEDSAIYGGRKVEFSKRAQLLASDVDYLFDSLDNSHRLTACADYKLPQVLRRYGILAYSAELQSSIRVGKEIPAHSEEEVEIRAHTIHAVELIKADITGVTSRQVNDYVWLEGQIKLPTDEPYHLTRTTAY
ncbi:hypothetical protein HYW21_04725 [Candidatus Woesearchaeota archaeon]|nr:hypothetical protein [Candidatus Woesearchaeota archaeon]